MITTTTIKDQLTDGVRNFLSKVKALVLQIKQKLVPGVEYTEDEKMVMQIIRKLLEMPETVKLTPNVGPYYLVNTELGYYVSVTDLTVHVTHEGGSLKIATPQLVGEAMRRLIENKIAQEAENFSTLMASASVSILTTFKNGLNIVDEESSH